MIADPLANQMPVCVCTCCPPRITSYQTLHNAVFLRAYAQVPSAKFLNCPGVGVEESVLIRCCAAQVPTVSIRQLDRQHRPRHACRIQRLIWVGERLTARGRVRDNQTADHNDRIAKGEFQGNETNKGKRISDQLVPKTGLDC